MVAALEVLPGKGLAPDWRRRLEARLLPLRGLPPSTPGGTADALEPAAVLIPIIERATGPVLLLTLRAKHLRHHAGQISFPGGRLEPGDSGPVSAALRETEEELGIPSTRIELLGRLPAYEALRAGFLITPVVGLLAADAPVHPNRREVTEVFELPLTFALDAANYRAHEGGPREALPYGERYIWGATLGMLRRLCALLDATGEPEAGR